ncbi:MAG: phospholipid carrier-dependent glycosyltransferase [Chloroflexi bacterium]|nr:phospholipid carrier-dependent glycosyltransferase [Chloroflexota bacterium]
MSNASITRLLARPFSNPIAAGVIYAAVLMGLGAYIVAGVSITPFHGDEATQIAMSRDYTLIFREGNLDVVRYQENPADPAVQELRLINGVVNKLLVGLALSLRGYMADDLNQPWDWGADWDYNIANGHAPSTDLLIAARLPSALLTALGLLPMFALGWMVGGRSGALIAVVLYALHPALLVNGRRAMMEGSMIAFSLFTVLAGVWFARTRSWWSAMLLALAAGLALASKHTAVFTLVAVYGACALLVLVDFARASREHADKPPVRALLWLVLSAVGALMLFYALNPTWWGDPIGRAGQVLALRSDLLAGQTTAFGGYPDTGAALSGWLRQAFIPPAQYYEVPAWAGAISGEISAYEASALDGVRDLQAAGLEGVLFNLLLPLAALAGLGSLIGRGSRNPRARTVIVLWVVAMVVTTALLTPLEWQRYYLPVHPAAMLMAAAGAAWSTRPAQRSARASEGVEPPTRTDTA